MPGLFHADNDAHFDCAHLRRRAAAMVSGLPLIYDAGRGDMAAAIALKTGFWPFVREFELAIDQQTLPRQPLARKFGEAQVRRTFTGIARAVREMKEEEGSHAAHWQKDAACLGIPTLSDHRVPGVQALIDAAYTKELPRFFAMLAGTEFVAEELSRYLTQSPAFTQLFSRRRWVWGEVHLAPHEDGPSHLEIDLDLARAYEPSDSCAEIEASVLDAIALFERAAHHVYEVALAA
jgi:hypothetical protein